MSAPQAVKPTGFWAANIGKFVVAFVAGFLLFTAVVMLPIRNWHYPQLSPSREAAKVGDQTISKPPSAQPVQASPTDIAPATAPTLPLTDSVAPQPILAPLLTATIAKTTTEAPTLISTHRRRKQAKHMADSMTENAEANPPPVVIESATDPEPEPAHPAETTKPVTVTLPADTSLAVKLTDELSTKTTDDGQVFRGVLAGAIEKDGMMVIPAGSLVTGRVVGSQRAGLVAGYALISLELIQIEDADGQHLPIKTNQWFRTGNRHRMLARKGAELVLASGEMLSFKLLQPVSVVRSH